LAFRLFFRPRSVLVAYEASKKNVSARGAYHNGDIGEGVKVNKDIPKIHNFFN